MKPDMPQDIEMTLKSLKANSFDPRFAQTVHEAREVMLEMIPATARIGVGDSTTLRQIGILEALIRRGNEVINPFTPDLTQGIGQDPVKRDLFLQKCQRTFGTDVFVTGSNALTRDGKIVSIDYAGNRVAGTIYGAPKVILAVGRNKIVRDVDEAIYRIKNVIAPAHAEQKKRDTPCAVTGECSDCNSPGRICSVTMILEKKPAHTALSVILINEDLGLGWDPAWDEKRISKVKSHYYRNYWVF